MSNKFALPEVSDEVELSRKTPYKKLNPIKLAEHNFFEKEGPIVIFFEVLIEVQFILIISLGSFNKWKRSS